MRHYFSMLETSIRQSWDCPALCDFKGKKYTYGEVAANIEKLHLFFETSGINKGDKIAICAKNSARWGIAFLSINTFEAVVVPILYDFTPEGIENITDHSDSILLFTDEDLAKKLDFSKMPQLRAVISINDYSILESRDDLTTIAAASLEANFNSKYPEGVRKEDISYPKDNLDKLALINYTSGTTSAPKGVMITFGNLNSNAVYGQDNMPSSQGDTIVSMLPMAHMYGMMFELIYPLCGSTAVYYLGKMPTPTILLSAFAEVKPYLIVTVPLVMEKIFKNSVKPVISKIPVKILTFIPGIRQIIFSKIREKLLGAFGGQVRMIILGGAAINPETEKWFRRIKLPFTVGYGMTEAAPLAAYTYWKKFVLRSCGQPVSRCEIRIDSEDPQNIPGEIQMRGDNIMIGYFKNPEATKAAFTDDGWLNTGDLGVMDANNFVYIRGRSKNMILTSNGQNIYPEEIEALVNNQPLIQESVVIDRDSKLVALVYPDDKAVKAEGIDKDALIQKMEQMRNTVNRELPSYSKISKVEIMDEPFIKTPKMSIKRFLYK